MPIICALRSFIRSGDYGCKIGRFERRAAYESAVHVDFGKQLFGVLGVHAAAVLDSGGFGELFGVELAQHFAWSLVAVLPVPIAHTGS